jgi:23S rRNA (uracil1939-C5)-methyltransferase
VVDAYAGTGSLTLFLARRAGEVVGIEEVAEAVEDARTNAALNGVRNASFHRGPVEELLPHFRAETVVLDPPRQGLTPRALAALLKVSPPRVVYVSCSPATLARDLRHLAESGYRLRNLAAFDFFPHTAHVEAVALLERES